MKRRRDFKAENARHNASASKRGLGRSQGRGHARSSESANHSKPVASDERLEAALRSLHQTGNQGAAAKEARVAPERFRRFLRQNALADRKGRTWRITDNRPRRMTV